MLHGQETKTPQAMRIGLAIVRHTFMTDSACDRLNAIYCALLASYVHGRLRMSEAEIGIHRTLIASQSFLAISGNTDWRTSPYVDVLEQVENLATRYGDSYKYVTYLGLLIYCTSLLDTFLSDTTEFLFLQHPTALGKNQSVSLDVLMSSGSVAEALNAAVAKRIREISYLPFLGRLQALNERFGFAIALDKETTEQLEHSSGLRNVAVHDQGYLELKLDSNRDVQLVQKASAKHPTPVGLDDLRTAAGAYDRTALAVAEVVIGRVLKAGEDPNLQKLLGHLRDHGESARRPLEIGGHDVKSDA